MQTEKLFVKNLLSVFLQLFILIQSYEASLTRSELREKYGQGTFESVKSGYLVNSGNKYFCKRFRY